MNPFPNSIMRTIEFVYSVHLTMFVCLVSKWHTPIVFDWITAETQIESNTKGYELEMELWRTYSNSYKNVCETSSPMWIVSRHANYFHHKQRATDRLLLISRVFTFIYNVKRRIVFMHSCTESHAVISHKIGQSFRSAGSFSFEAFFETLADPKQ